MAADREEVEVPAPYALLDAEGRTALLDRLTARVLAVTEPVQVWHGPVPCRVDAPGTGAADRLTRELAAAARPRRTWLCRPEDELPCAPAGKESATALQLPDGTWHRTLAVTRWPARLSPGWLDAVAELAASIVLHLRPLPDDAAARLLRRRLTSMCASASVDDQAGRLPDPEVAVATDSAEELQLAVASGTTRLLHCQLLVGVAAPTRTELDLLDHQVRTRLRSVLAEVRGLTFEQGPGWAASRPGAGPVREPWRLLDAACVAASIPLPLGAGAAASGVLAGVDPQSGAPLLVDRFAGHNPARLVVGTSGAGKSYASKLEALRQLALGTRVVVVDPEGEFGRLADVLGGLTIAVGEEPAGLDPVGLACRPSLAPAEGLAVLAGWAAALIGEPLSAVDLALLDWSLGVLRADPGGHPGTSDLLAVVSDIAAHPPFTGASLPARLSPAAGGSLAHLFAPNPDLADPPALVVFDLRCVPDRARPAVMACVLAWAWQQQSGTQPPGRRLLVVDEAHLLLDDPAAAHLLAQLARRARKYGLALEVVTQRLSDFLGRPAGEAVLANTGTKLLLACEDHERAAVVGGLGLTGGEGDLLVPGPRGRGLLLTPSWRGPVHVVAAPPEHELASAGPR